MAELNAKKNNYPIEYILQYPYEFEGAKVEKLVIKERMKVHHSLKAEEMAGGVNNVSRFDLCLYAVICNEPMEKLLQLDMVDYQQLKESYEVFLGTKD